MPDTNVVDTSASIAAGRPDRAVLFGFVCDAASETALREGLADIAPSGFEIRRGSARQAIAALKKMPTPRTLIVDISGDEQPVSALVELSDVVEPDVRVLVIGDREDTNLYRQITRGLGVLEYVYKPLTRGMIDRLFAPWIGSAQPVQEITRGGRIVGVTGVRGGVGATTIAANLAWHFAEGVRRHTLLLDPNFHTGDAALMLGAKSGNGLRTILESPDRLDELFLERTAQPAGERLFVIAGEESLGDQPNVSVDSVAGLYNLVRRRFNFVVVDAPFRSDPFHRALFDLVQQRVLVTEPSLSATRDVMRMIALSTATGQRRAPVVVLNRAGQPGGLTRRQVEETLGQRIDIVIPWLPKVARAAATLGQPVGAVKGPFRDAIHLLAREAAFTRLVDAEPEKKRPWFSLLTRRRAKS
jgi:pilus assembly protein CpaE